MLFQWPEVEPIRKGGSHTSNLHTDLLAVFVTEDSYLLKHNSQRFQFFTVHIYYYIAEIYFRKFTNLNIDLCSSNSINILNGAIVWTKFPITLISEFGTAVAVNSRST